MYIKNSSAKQMFINILFLILLFLTCLDSITDILVINKVLHHFDELITILLACYVVYNYKNILFLKRYLTVFFCGLGFIGLVSSVIYEYQSVIAVLIDAFVITSRFIIGYLAVIIFAKKTKKGFSHHLVSVVRLVTVSLFVLAVHDLLFFPIFPKSDYRYFTYGLQLMFPHATFLASAQAILLIFLGYKNQNNKNLVYMFMATFVGMMTLRGKAVAFFVVYWVLYVLLVIWKQIKHIYVMMAFSLAIGVFIGWDRIMDNFSSTAFRPRSIMLKDGIRLMIDHFPLGTGFASFGSTLAERYYSPIYTRLGYPMLDGMGPGNSMYLHDGFWHTICAQFGVFGLIIFLLVVWCFFSISLNKIKKNRYAGVAMVATLIYLLISSTGEAAFFSPTALLFFMLFAVYEREL